MFNSLRKGAHNDSVAGDVSQSNFRLRSNSSNPSKDQAAGSLGLNAEHMFDATADFRFPMIGRFLFFVLRTVSIAFFVNAILQISFEKEKS
ncbi:hypothetical protein [uncultured Rubinisphaera sp.]|uniref:hypothetical protein n=1 Tax=uncultured Rubinisphaera sp. TaxID=1678686 RepID=UPI0030DDD4CF